MVSLSYTSPQLVSLLSYYVLQWIFFSLCLVAFSARAYIRYVCFRRLLFEDWLMILALGVHLSIAILGQVFMRDIYELTAAEHGGAIGAGFFTDALRALKAFGIISVLSIAGIWLIKLNFLLFFYRLGHQVYAYRILWWIVFVFSIGCGASCFGLLQYPCMFGDIQTVFVKCATPSAVRDTYTHVIMTAVVDILSDAAILCFPIAVLWKVKVTLRKKFILAAIFGLVGFTIAVTIVRGSIFGGVYKSINATGGNEVNITWILFWFYVEFTVSFIIACVVSFRTLFVHKEKQSAAKDEERRRQESVDRRKENLLQRMRRLHDSILETCRTLEGPWEDSNISPAYRLPKPPSGRLSVDFSRDHDEFSSWTHTNSSDDLYPV